MKKNWLPFVCLLTVSLCGVANAQWKPDTGMVIRGKVVTMNDAGDV